ncbi:MAG: glucose PTS transporter subunit IIA, partial [Mycoplasmataceae bacterium]|nr:glucose PTS transporter subunit IIA [Mycoplasmataceae bacterium]
YSWWFRCWKTWRELTLELNSTVSPESIEQNYVGDQQIWAFLNSFLAGREIKIGDSVKIIQFSDFTTNIYTEAFNKLPAISSTIGSAGVNAGQYMQGKYPFMMFGLPAAAAAMVMAAPKENRKMAGSMVASAGATSFLTGITEPLEFTFLFLAPWLFWGFHAFFAAMSFGLMTWIGLIFPSIAPHIGMTFSGGALDWIIYGAVQIPGGSNAWVSLLIGIAYVPIYYFFFYWAIKKFNIGTPGRGENTKLYSKEDYKNRNSNSELTDNKVLALRVIQAYGGLKNIKNTDACITKLRIQVESQDIVNHDQLKELGAVGVIKPSAQSVYAIFGAKADLIKNQILKIKSEIEDNPSLEAKWFAEIGNSNYEATPNSSNILANGHTEMSTEKLIVYSPISGRLVNLKDIPDKTFSEKMVGDGVGIAIDNHKVVSPIDGNVELAFPGGHAYVIKSKAGTNIMIHIGIDSVNVNGEDGEHISLFNPYVEAGNNIDLGDDIVQVDVDNLNMLASSNISPVIVLNESIQGRKIKIIAKKGIINIGDPLFELIPVK